ncbi:MAG: hypothetical protein GEV08_16305 [Acidimicrobiia bacterium]|nr:hypothetical protein [Acidimicrobiia bacterium]
MTAELDEARAAGDEVAGVEAPGDEAVRLGEVGSARAALVLAGRLVAEGVGARAVGAEVWVRSADRDRALTFAQLFHEVDRGASQVAPRPGAWAEMRAGRAVRVAVVVVFVLVALAAVAAAILL